MEQDETKLDKDLSLSCFIKSSEARLDNLLAKFQWNVADVLKSFNTNSQASQHKDTTKREPAFPESFAATNSVKLERDEFQKLVGDPTATEPKRFSDLQLNFTREQKLRLYKFVSAQADAFMQTTAADIFIGDNQVDFSKIVALKKKENQKRRKYRISKPTHIEEVRALVELQMQSLEQYLEKKRLPESGTKKREHPRYRAKNDDHVSRRHKRRYETSSGWISGRGSFRERFRSTKRKSRESDSRHRSRKRRSRSRKRSRSRSRARTKSRSRARTKSRIRMRTRSSSRALTKSRVRSSSRSRAHKKKRHKSRQRERSGTSDERSYSKEEHHHHHKSKRHKTRKKHKKRSKSRHSSGSRTKTIKRIN